MKIQKKRDEIMSAFEKLHTCIQDGCNQNGTVPDQNGEAEQCQYCFQKRFPLKSFLISSLDKISAEAYREGLAEILSKAESMDTAREVRHYIKERLLELMK